MFDFNHWLNRFPGTNFHELNIDWLCDAVKQLAWEIHNFEQVNAIKYCGIWSITKAYAPQSVVITSDATKGYISKKPVPEGITLDNTEYWELVANYTPIVGDLGDRVTALEADNVTNKANISFIQKELDTQFDPWSSRKVIYVGDSYGRGRTYPNTYSISWCDQVTSRLSPAASYNLCVSQASFAESQPDYLRYGRQLYDFVEQHSSSVCESITDIIIAGGYNETFAMGADILNTNTTYCAKWTAAYIKQNFPNARVFIGFIGRVPVFGGSNASFDNFRDRIQKYKDIAVKYNWEYIENCEYMAHDYTLLTNDGIHFKEAGYQQIGNRIAEYLVSRHWNYPQYPGAQINIEPMADTSNNSIVITNTPGIYNQFSNAGISIFSIDSGTLNFFCNDTNITTDTPIKVGRYYNKANELYNRFVAQYNKRILCYVGFYNNYSLVQGGMGYIVFKDDGTITINTVEDDSSSTPISIDQIYVILPDIFIPYSEC